jgi:hypothetical protein
LQTPEDDHDDSVSLVFIGCAASVESSRSRSGGAHPKKTFRIADRHGASVTERGRMIERRSKYTLQLLSGMSLVCWLVVIYRGLEPNTKSVLLLAIWGAPYLWTTLGRDIPEGSLVGISTGTSVGGLATAAVFLLSQLLGGAQAKILLALEMLFIVNALLFLWSVVVWLQGLRSVRKDRAVLALLFLLAYMGFAFVVYDSTK